MLNPPTSLPTENGLEEEALAALEDELLAQLCKLYSLSLYLV